MQLSFNQHKLLYPHIRTLCIKLFLTSCCFTSSAAQYVQHCKQMLLFYRNKVSSSQTPQWNRKNQTQHCSYLCSTPAVHTCHTHTSSHTVNWEHSPSIQAQTNTLKIQTTHIQTLSLLNELALLRKDSATTLYHTLIPCGELAIGRDEQKKRSTLGYERGREKGGERRNQKAPGEREESRKRKVLHLAPHISKEDDRRDKKWGEGAGAQGVWVGDVDGGGVVCCRSRQTNGWVNRLMGVKRGESRGAKGWVSGWSVHRCWGAGGGNEADRVPSTNLGPTFWWDCHFRLIYTHISLYLKIPHLDSLHRLPISTSPRFLQTAIRTSFSILLPSLTHSQRPQACRPLT